ncbi:unnamed protein product, partial [Ixodes hexagonus]
RCAPASILGAAPRSLVSSSRGQLPIGQHNITRGTVQPHPSFATLRNCAGGLRHPLTTSCSLYDALKAAILERTMLSERKRLQQLVSAEELGDRRPSQLLRQMQALLGERAATFDSQFLKEQFLQRLPPSVQMILATASDLSLPALALHTDKIMEVANQHLATSTVSSVQHSEPATQAFHAPAAPADARDEIAALRQDVQHLQELVANTLRLSLPHSPRRPSQSRSSLRRSSSPHANRQPRPNQPRQEQQHCWYHQCFGATAERCTRPCSWSKNETRDR